MLGQIGDWDAFGICGWKHCFQETINTVQLQHSKECAKAEFSRGLSSESSAYPSHLFPIQLRRLPGRSFIHEFHKRLHMQLLHHKPFESWTAMLAISGPTYHRFVTTALYIRNYNLFPRYPVTPQPSLNPNCPPTGLE